MSGRGRGRISGVSDFVWSVAEGSAHQTVVVVPGVASAPEAYAPLAAAWVSAGFNAAVVRHVVRAPDYGIADVADHVCAVIAELAGDYGQSEVVVIGHGTGGVIAAVAAGVERNRSISVALRLVTVGTSAQLPRLWRWSWRQSTGRARGPGVVGDVRGAVLPRQLRRELKKLRTTGRVHELRRGQLCPRDVFTTHPTLVMGWMDDAVAPAGAVAAFHLGIPVRVMAVSIDGDQAAAPSRAAHQRVVTEPERIVDSVVSWLGTVRPLTEDEDPLLFAIAATGLNPRVCTFGDPADPDSLDGQRARAQMIYAIADSLDHGQGADEGSGPPHF